MRRDPHDEHPAITTARHLTATANTWPDLVRALTPAPRTPGAGRVTGTSGRPLPINTHVHDVMTDISQWVYFWARNLHNETDWTLPPNPLDTPALLRALALRVGHFVEHPDQLIAQAFIDEADDVRHKAERTAHPTGARRIPVHVPCLERPCPGQYTVLLQPDRDWRIPDLVCNRDHHHRITPAEWQKLERRRPADPSAARALLTRIRGT